MSKSDEEDCLSLNSDNERDKMEHQSSKESVRSPILERRLPEKRVRQESDENEDEGEFITVTRSSKRLNRSTSINKDNGINNADLLDNLVPAEEKYEICMTSKEVLPKQMGLAKLLQRENISGVLSVKYKNPYRVLIQFDNDENAEKLCKCTGISDLGYRCQFTQKINLSYGVVKNIDLDVEDNELQEVLSSDCELVSVRRMKRFNGSQWVNSETIRVCFKGSTLPPYVCGYGCRFKVEPYIFPVTQCSGCWRFGHLIRQCPTKKVICPKCGGLHENCDTTQYQCINCKGSHMALNKKCPSFLKEKQIRLLMSQGNYTYKKALYIYLQEQNTRNNISYEHHNYDSITNNTQHNIAQPSNKDRSYCEVVSSKKRYYA